MKKFILVLAAVLAVSILIITLVNSTLSKMAHYDAEKLVIIPGTYKTEWVVTESRSMSGTTFDPPLTSKVPRSIKRIPSFISKKPLFGSVMIRYDFTSSYDGTFLALDESKGTGTGYDTLYLDMNGNCDLSDDSRVLESTDSDGKKIYHCPPIPFNVIYPKSKNTTPVSMDVEIDGKSKVPDSYMLGLRGYWKGKLKTNKGDLSFKLIDETENGSFADTPAKMLSRDQEAGDSVQFICDDNRRFHRCTNSYLDIHTCDLSTGVNIAGRLYNLKASISGDSLVISEYKGPKAQIKLKLEKIGPKSIKDVGFFIQGDTARNYFSGNTVALVPAGKFRLENVSIGAARDAKADWDIECSIEKILSAPENQTTNVPVGGKPYLTITEPKSGLVLKRGATMDIASSVRFSAGGELSGMSVSGKGTTDFGEEKIVLKNSKGIVVQRWDPMTISLSGAKLPDNIKPGKYKLEVSRDTGPFGGILTASRDIIVK